jgi:hypothetical protein
MDACPINFNDFTLDKGVTNPNTASTKTGKSGKQVDVEELYEKKRNSRDTKPALSSAARTMLKNLNENQSLVKQRKTKTETKTKKNSATTAGTKTRTKTRTKKRTADGQPRRPRKKRARNANGGAAPWNGGGWGERNYPRENTQVYNAPPAYRPVKAESRPIKAELE